MPKQFVIISLHRACFQYRLFQLLIIVAQAFSIYFFGKPIITSFSIIQGVQKTWEFSDELDIVLVMN